MRRSCLWAAMLMILPILHATSVSADQRDTRLDPLFERLKETDDLADAAVIQHQIWQIWITFDDLSISRLMQRGMAAMSEGDHDRAYEAFDSMVDQAPDFAEAWNKRATVLYLMGRLDESVLDIQQTLELEPRHFGALSGLSLIYELLEEPAAAIRSLEAALAINPHLIGSKERIRLLQQKLKGVRT